MVKGVPYMFKDWGEEQRYMKALEKRVLELEQAIQVAIFNLDCYVHHTEDYYMPKIVLEDLRLALGPGKDK